MKLSTYEQRDAVMLQIRQLLATPDDFQRWLAIFKRTDIVGDKEDTYSCPLAKYLMTVIPGYRVFVHANFITFAQLTSNYGQDAKTAMEGRHVFLPFWAREFICKVDKGRKQQVGAMQAKNALKYALTMALAEEG